MLKLLTKIFLSSGPVLGTFVATGSLANQKKDNDFLLVNKPKATEELEEITSVQDVLIFEKKHNCSFSFSHKWSEQQVYGIEKFLATNTSDDYRRKAISKANEFKKECKDKGLIVLFFFNGNFDLKGNLSDG